MTQNVTGIGIIMQNNTFPKKPLDLQYQTIHFERNHLTYLTIQYIFKQIVGFTKHNRDSWIMMIHES